MPMRAGESVECHPSALKHTEAGASHTKKMSFFVQRGMLSPYANYTAVDEAPPAPDPEGESNEWGGRCRHKGTQLVTSQV